jgi:outer membrane receptor protein involved in Fe transport
VNFRSIRERLLASTTVGGTAVAAFVATTASAQDVPMQPRTSSTVAASALAAAAAQGQGTVAQSSASTVKEVVVTGSRIPRPNANSVSPVETVSQQEFKLEGTVDVETLLNNLPSVSPSVTQFSNNGATGIATVDLRGFGANRTLVLIDGRRMPPGDPQTPVPDLNLLPSSLVDSVDVLTGGASSVYGSDAVAGVVNFKMKHNFEGVQMDAQFNIAEHDNDDALAQSIAKAAGHDGVPTGATWQGRTEHITITFGANTADGKGNLEGYLGYVDQEPVRQAAYDFAYCAISGKFGYKGQTYGETGHACGGSSNSAYGRFNGKFWGAYQGSTFVPGATQSATVNLSDNPGPAGNFVAYSSPPPGATARTWNYAPYQYFQRQDERYQGGYFAHYDINSHITAYSDFLFQDDRSTGQLAPSGQFSNNGAVNQITCDNPLASASQLAALCGPAPYQLNSHGQVVAVGDPTATSPVYGGAGSTNLSQPFALAYRLQNNPRDYLLQHDSFKMDEGVRGDIDDVWSYDVYLQYGKSIADQTVVGDVSKAKINNALQVGPSGKCINGDPACVPFDIFTPLSQNVSTAAFNYLEESASNAGYTTQQIVSGNLVGKLGKYGVQSPWAHEGVGIAFGAEYRRDFIRVAPDAASTSGDIAGGAAGGVPSTQGSTSVKDLYVESILPVVQDHFLMKDVTLDIAYRRSDYNLAGTSDTYKFGGDWAVTPDLRFRGAFNRTERAPNVLELFTPAQLTNQGFADPCSGAAPKFSAAQCYNTAKNLGVTEQQFAQIYYGNISACPAGQCNGLTGGNEKLRPEVGDTTTLGFFFQPHWFRGFSMSLDYWDIALTGAVGTVPFETTLQGCLANGAAPLCNNIFRDPSTGAFIGATGYVQGNLENIGGVHKKGYDIQWDYRFRLKDTGFLPDWGGVSMNFVGTYMMSDTSTVPTSPDTTHPNGLIAIQCAGLYGPTCSGVDGVPDPRWRHKYRVTWATPWKVDFSIQWRYIQQVKADVNSGNPDINNGNPPAFIDGHIPAYSWIDLAAQYRVRDNITLRAGVNNVFDKEPPALDTNAYPLAPGSGNTFANMYDPLGRTIFVNLTAKF